MAFGNATFNGESLFSSGPHIVNPGGIVEAAKRTSFPGLDGEARLTLGRRARPLAGQGTLKAETQDALQTLVEAIEAFRDGVAYTLVDTRGTSHEDCTLEQFDTGRYHQISASEFCCDWRALWLKLGG